jgi:cobalt/nickel transport system permease protein
MHIAEGALSPEVLVAGAVVAAAGVAIGLRKMDYEQIPQVAVLSAAFFVASLVHVPIGPSSAHLILNGLTGVILGWMAFPALLVALFLQAILFGFGGVTALGVNTVVMALPGVICYYLFNRPIRNATKRSAFGLGFATGVAGIILGAVILSLALLVTSSGFLNVVKLTLIAHIPVMVIEGLITGVIIVFLKKVRPEILGASEGVPRGEKTAYA